MTKDEIEAKFVLPLDAGAALLATPAIRETGIIQVQLYAEEFRFRFESHRPESAVIAHKVSTADPLVRVETEAEVGGGAALFEWAESQRLPRVDKFRCVLEQRPDLLVTLDLYLSNRINGATEAYIVEAEGTRAAVLAYRPPPNAIDVTKDRAWKAKRIARVGLPLLDGYTWVLQ